MPFFSIIFQHDVHRNAGCDGAVATGEALADEVEGGWGSKSELLADDCGEDGLWPATSVRRKVWSG